MDSAPPLSPPPPESQLPEMSLPARLLNIFASPGEVFDYIRLKPHSVANWIVPAVLIIAVSLIAAGFIVSNEALSHQAEEIADKTIEKQHLSGPQADMTRKIVSFSTRIGPLIGPMFGAIIAPFWTGLVLWLVGAKILKGSFGYMKAVEAGGLANMVTLLDLIVKLLLILAMGNLMASLSPALLMKNFNPENPAHAALALLNPMLFWALMVQAVALSRLSGRSLGVAAMWIFGIALVCTGTCMGIGFGMQAAFRPH
jgi:hypothetical protein